MEDFIMGAYELAVGTKFFTSIKNTVDIDLSSGSPYAAMWEAAGDLYSNVFVPLGIGLLLVFFVIGITDKVSDSTDSVEQMMKEFVKFILATAIIDRGWSIITYCVNIGYALLNKVGHTITINEKNGMGGTIDVMADIVKDNGFMENIFICIPILLLVVISFVIRGLIILTCYSRTITICLMASIFPICMPDIYHKGVSGNGFRYLKSFLAVCMQGAVILVIAYLTCVCTSALLIDVSDHATVWEIIEALIVPIVVQLAGVSMIMKSLNFCKEVLGV